MRSALLAAAMVGCLLAAGCTEQPALRDYAPNADETTLAMMQSELERDSPRMTPEMKTKLCAAYTRGWFAPGNQFMEETYSRLSAEYTNMGRPFTPDVTVSSLAQVYQGVFGPIC